MKLNRFDGLVDYFFEYNNLNPLKNDEIYLQAMEVIGAISCLSEKIFMSDSTKKSVIETTKLRIFWKTIQEIANQQLDETKDKDGFLLNARSAVKMLLTAFPDRKKKGDGRMWLPMHFAVSVPSIEFQDIRVLFAHQPKTISKATTIELTYGPPVFSVTPYHLAVTTQSSNNIALIELLQNFNRRFGSLTNSNGSTPLHFAAEFSNSVAVIYSLIQMNPKALTMCNVKGETPLCCVARNSSVQAPEILTALIEAAPHTVSLNHKGTLPLHRFISIDGDYEYECADKRITKELVLILLEAFPNAVNIPDADGWYPIHVAALESTVDILRIITEANPEHLSKTNPTTRSVAHFAANSGCLSTRYIHSMMPELFHTVDDQHQTPLHFAIERMQASVTVDQIELLANLVPETANNVDIHGNNLLHTLVENAKKEDQLERLIRLFLRLIPGGALATNNQGQTPYDLMDADDSDSNMARRLLLLAGAPSLHPETRQQMNYQARKGALFALGEESIIVVGQIYATLSETERGPWRSHGR